MTRLAAVAALCLLTGCASLSEEECRSGDWGAIGQRDGVAGRVADIRFARHVKACRTIGVTPERTQWDAGYMRGLQDYCTPRSGLTEGVEGRRYRDVCPAMSEAGFLRGFRVGTADHAARRDVDRAQDDMSRLHARNTAILTRLAEDDDPALRAELRSNRSELLRLRLELGFARAEAARTRRAVAEFTSE